MSLPFADGLIDRRVRLIPNGDGTYSLAVATTTGVIPITQPLHDLLNANVNIQVGDVDVSDTNPVAVKGLGAAITLAPLVARTVTAGTNGTPVSIDDRVAFAILLTFTNKADDVDDTCDVYIDMLIGATWVNAVHFTQVLGNAADASAEYALLMPSAQTTVLNVSTNAASGIVRPEVLGSQIRVRWVIADPTGADATFTFSVVAWVI